MFSFKQRIRKFKAAKKRLPVAIGAMAKSHYLKAFREEGFTDKQYNAWAKRKRPNRSDRRNKARRGLLVNKGHLRRSIRVVSASFNRIKVGSVGIKYARFHNRGEGRLPERKFVGRSAVLNEKIRRRIRREIKSVL